MLDSETDFAQSGQVCDLAMLLRAHYRALIVILWAVAGSASGGTKKPSAVGTAEGGKVVLPGFEPGLKEPKTLVLPLHHKTILGLQ